MYKKNILKKEGKVAECTGCQLCSAVCPFDAIEIRLDKEGFYKPYINEKCVQCTKCIDVCYKFDNKIERSRYEDLKTYSAKTKDKILLKESTSGGIATHIAEYAIENDFYVVGVIYNYEKDIAEYKIIKTKDELVEFKGSKYIQAYAEKEFKKIIQEKSDKNYLIFGLPCHIYALNKYVKKINKREKFVFIDLYCHGCPSMNLWKKYIGEIKNRLKIQKFSKVEFRSKKKGWHEFCIYLEGENKSYLSKSGIRDYFYKMFFSDYVLNLACYDCKLRSTMEYTDVRLGDFWGQKFDLDTEGVSLVTSRTESGNKIIESISHKILLKEENILEGITNQSYGKKYKKNLETRKKLLQNLMTDMALKKIIKLFTRKLDSKTKMVYLIKGSFDFVPKKVKYFIRKLYHQI